MEISFENLGFIKKGKVKTNDITIIFGPNNVGKTYLSYSIFSVLSQYRRHYPFVSNITQKMASEVYANKSYSADYSSLMKVENQKNICEGISTELSKFFKDTSGVLRNVKISASDIDEYKHLKLVSFRVRIPLSETSNLFIEKKKNSKIVNFIVSSLEIDDESDGGKQKVTLKLIHSRMKALMDYVLKTRFFDFIGHEPFIITSERTGISIFLKEIDSNRNDIVNKIAMESVSKGFDDDDDFIKKIMTNRVSNFAEPINHNINAVRGSLDGKPSSQIDYSDENFIEIERCFNDLVCGGYKIVSDDIYFSSKIENGDDLDIPISMASGAGKSLYLMNVFIRKYISKNSYLIIDEPELNLHPANQIKMASLIVLLANYGVKVIITTHSDYLVKEINNRIMAYKLKEKPKVLEEVGYTSQHDVISHERVSAFTITHQGNIEEIESNAYGVSSSLFDAVIVDVDDRADKLISEMLDYEHD
ncbi:AAA family ATPase [Dickeya zeae]|uniref:AAA family ATPase n=1 Tax=Dickeya zeae TaxID=204042 RepID=UPI00143FF976|nr:AAA family ATPase [Dickeya zeae]QIZ46584.1 ATP-binding protein [Dickeya zeae]